MSLERQRDGIAQAKAAGKYKGRKPALDKAKADELRSRLSQGESVSAPARKYGMTRQTVYNYKVV
jgi:DNA invertase Pin-like site-specific DNA recombinase